MKIWNVRSWFLRDVHTQSEIKNLRGHSVRLGIEAETADGEPVNMEI